jgi:phage terminase small subunit
MAIFSLEPKQQRFINLYMTGTQTLVDLARLLQVSVSTLRNWLKKEEIQLAMAETKQEVQKQVAMHINEMTLKATRRLSELVESPIDAVALQAVKDVLDRGGHKAKQEIKVEKTVITVEQKLKELVDATIIEGDFEEVEGE